MSGDALGDEDCWIAGSDDEQIELISTVVEVESKKKRKSTAASEIAAQPPKVKKAKKDPNYNEIRDMKTCDEVAEYMWKQMIRDFKNITQLELADLEKYRVDAGSVIMPSDCSIPHELKEGEDYFKQVIQKYVRTPDSTKKPTQTKGRPNVLIVTSGAVRATHLIREMRQVSKCKVAKLFSKHMDIEGQLKFLNSTHVELAVGTPNRLLKLSEKKKDMLSEVKLVVVDVVIDVKNRCLFDMPECRADFNELLKALMDMSDKKPIFSLF